MLPLLRPLLFLSFLEQQSKAKLIENEGLPITINDFNNSANEDMLCESPLINAETTTDMHFNMQNKKALLQELI